MCLFRFAGFDAFFVVIFHTASPKTWFSLTKVIKRPDSIKKWIRDSFKDGVLVGTNKPRAFLFAGNLFWQPVPTVQWESVLIQNILREVLSFSTDSEGLQNQLWSDFWISPNQSKIQRIYSVFLWIRRQFKMNHWISSESDKFSAKCGLN